MPTYSYTVNTSGDGGSSSTSGVEASNADAIKQDIQEAFGTDVFYDSDMALTPKGDYVLVSGFQALRQALYHRLITRPGEYAFVPDYGIGIQSFIKKKMTQTNIDGLKNRIKTQVLREARVSSIRSLVLAKINGGVEIHLTIEAAGRALQFRPFSFTRNG